MMNHNDSALSRVEAILRSPVYNDYMEKICRREAARRFCRHDRGHCWETARAAYILFLSGAVDCPELKDIEARAAQEMIYAAAFLHDIGRFLEYEDPSKDHAAEGAVLARPLLAEAGFSEAESERIVSAIAHHRRKDNTGFDLLLYRADKESRPCFDCPVLSECKKYSPAKKPRITV